jgi:DNA replication protein DnaC
VSTPEYDLLLHQLKHLRLGRIAEVLDGYTQRAVAANMSYLDFLRGLIQEAMSAQDTRIVNGRIKAAHFPYLKTLEQFDFNFQPSVSRQKIADLATLRFIENHENAILLGPPGVGKTQPTHYPSRFDVGTGGDRHGHRPPSSPLRSHAAVNRHCQPA